LVILNKNYSGIIVNADVFRKGDLILKKLESLEKVFVEN